MRVLASEIRKNLSFEWTLTLNSYVALVKSVNASAQYKMWMLPLSSSSKLWSSVSSLEFHLYSINGSRLGQIPLLGWRLWWRTRLPMQETEEMWVWSLGWDNPLEGHGNPLQYSCLERILEERGGLQSIGSQRIRHDCRDLAWTPQAP